MRKIKVIRDVIENLENTFISFKDSYEGIYTLNCLYYVDQTVSRYVDFWCHYFYKYVLLLIKETLSWRRLIYIDNICLVQQTLNTLTS